MKKDIHPQYYSNAKVVCACGNTWETGSTQSELRVEICSSCHPFYTGKQKLVDTARRVEKFQERMAKKTSVAKTRKGKKVKKETRASKRKSIAEKTDKLETKKLEIKGTREIKKLRNKETKGAMEISNGSTRLTADEVNKINKIVDTAVNEKIDAQTEK